MNESRVVEAAKKPLVESWSDAYRPELRAAQPEWLAALRDRAAAEFARSGLPQRKDEAWKYTPVRALEALDPRIAGGREKVADSAAFTAALPKRLIEAPDMQVDIADGTVAEIPQGLPDGVTILSLAEGLKRFEQRLSSKLHGADISGSSRAFAALNTAFLEQGLVIHVGEAVQAGTLLLRWAFTPGQTALMHNFRVFILLERGAGLSVVEQYQSAQPSRNALNVVTDAELGQGASLQQLRVQAESEDAVLLLSTSVEQAADSFYANWGFDFGGGLVRQELSSRLAGAGARAQVGGAFVLDGKRHVDNHVSIEHAAVDTHSEQFFRGVLGGRSRGVFNGRAMIHQGADGSKVQQSNANLLLSPLAEIDTKPELEIYADEVEASHGATVGQLDETAVFYLRSRGLDEEAARRMLTSAFCRAVTDRLGDRLLAHRLDEMMDAAMPQGMSLPGGAAGSN